MINQIPKSYAKPAYNSTGYEPGNRLQEGSTNYCSWVGGITLAAQAGGYYTAMMENSVELRLRDNK